MIDNIIALCLQRQTPLEDHEFNLVMQTYQDASRIYKSTNVALSYAMDELYFKDGYMQLENQLQYNGKGWFGK